jgi:hypothetical protein
MHELNSYSDRKSDYTGLPIINDECAYTFHVYPSIDMKDRKYQARFSFGFIGATRLTI